MDSEKSLKLDVEQCIGCGTCTEVCPFNVYKIVSGKAKIVNINACVECGACAASCPVDAITVKGQKASANVNQDELHKRMLGSEWEDWDGKAAAVKIDEPKRLFLFYFFLFSLFNSVLLYGILYLIKPRLDAWNEYITPAVFVVFTLYLAFLWIWFLFLLLTSYTRMRLPFLNRKAGYLVNTILTRVYKISSFFRTDKDKVSNSFVKIGNEFTKSTHKKREKERLLILLPRCLTGKIFKSVKKMCNERNIELAIVEGGTLARKKIIEFKPTAIIGVACERDVVAGIKDVAPKFSVLGVCNERPQGPCRNTVIDMDLLGEHIDYFLGVNGKSER